MGHQWNKIPQKKTVIFKSKLSNNNETISTENTSSRNEMVLDDSSVQRNTSSNRTMVQAHNQLQKNPELFHNVMGSIDGTHSLTTVVVIGSIFLFLTMGMTAALVVFCRKRNSVFALQKSEQEDTDLELDDLNSDFEFTETEFESEVESLKSHKSVASHRVIDSDFENSPTHKPLMATQPESEVEDSPMKQPTLQHNNGARPKQCNSRTMYGKNTIQRNKGKGHQQFVRDISAKYLQNKGNKYEMVTSYSSDNDSDIDNGLNMKLKLAQSDELDLTQCHVSLQSDTNLLSDPEYSSIRFGSVENDTLFQNTSHATKASFYDSTDNKAYVMNS